MVARSYERGWPIQAENGKDWIYSDTRLPVDGKRKCVRCDKKPTKEGYDACLGYIEGVTSACCGHGVSSLILMGE